MARLVQGPARFTEPEWVVSNKTKYKNAETERQIAERLVAESKRLTDETDERNYKTQIDVNKKFEQRIDDIQYWREEIDRKLKDVKNETDSLDTFCDRIKLAIQTCAEPLHIAQQNLANREKRLGVELVHDHVQMELLKEVDVIQGVLELLHKTLDQVKEQSRLNRKTAYYLENDIRDKDTALTIDTHNRQLTDNTPGNNLCPTGDWIDPKSLSVGDWQRATEDGIKTADREIGNSMQLRSLVDGVIQQTWADVTKQRDATDRALAKRIRETTSEKAKMEEHLQKVLAQIREMEENIDRLRKAIAEKTAPLKLAQTRLCSRQERPDMELARDNVQYRMISEVGELEESIAKLNDVLSQTNHSVKALRRQQLELEEDIERKGRTIFVDEVENGGMRSSINIQPW